MTAKNGNISLILKLVLAVAAVVSIVLVALRQFREIVVVEPVTRGAAVSAVPGSVEVAADHGGIRPLKNRLEGRVEKCDMLVTETKFKKGDMLLTLDTTDLDREITEVKRNFDSAQAERKLLLDASIEKIVAKETLDNLERGEKRGEVPAEAVKNARRALDGIEKKMAIEEFRNKKAIEDQQAYLDAKKLQRERMSIIAEEDGVIKDVFVWKGALIGAGSAVATFLSNERVVAAKVSEENFHGIAIGQDAKVQFLIYPGEKPFDAKVSKIESTADEATQRYRIFLDVKVNPERLVHGSTGQVTITVGRRENALLVPRRALFNGSNLFVVKNGTVQLRKIDLGFIDLNRAEALGGLSEGELVIVENIDQFHDGQSVRLPAAK